MCGATNTWQKLAVPCRYGKYPPGRVKFPRLAERVKERGGLSRTVVPASCSAMGGGGGGGRVLLTHILSPYPSMFNPYINLGSRRVQEGSGEEARTHIPFSDRSSTTSRVDNFFMKKI